MKHILIIDDDERLRELLKRYLIKNDYQVSASADTAAASKLMQSLNFDLLVVDVMMPDEDGISFVRRIRKEEHSNVPVLMLTAKTELEDRLKGFEAGIDDYLPKPFEPRELLFRIEAILRRSQSSELRNGFVTIDEFHYDLDNQKLFRGEEKIDLTRSERDLMSVFASRLGQEISREELLESLGGDASLRTVDVQIARLRKKIERDPKSPSLIQTVRGAGYKMLAK